MGRNQDKSADWPTLHGDLKRAGRQVKAAAYGSITGPVWAFGDPRSSVDADYTPVVAGDTVFVGADYWETGEIGRIHALSAATGEKRWRFRTELPVEAPPTVASDTVFATCGAGNVYALDRETGISKWRYSTDGLIATAWI